MKGRRDIDFVTRGVFRTHLQHATGALGLAGVLANQNGVPEVQEKLLEIVADIEDLMPAEPTEQELQGRGGGW